MTHTVQYKGTYTDSSGTVEIVITNDFEIVSCEIDGVKFAGREFSDFVLIDEANYTEEQLKRFSFYTWQSPTTGLIEGSLSNCSFTLIIPQIVIDKTKGIELCIDLHIDYLLGKQRPKPGGGLDEESVKLSMTIDGQNFGGTEGFLEIERAFDQIKEEFDNQYHFKNCYGCMFGDYSVYGQSGFGTMLCFVHQKEAYSQTRGKTDYLGLTDEYDIVQEIYCCDNYEIRKAGVGYRG